MFLRDFSQSIRNCTQLVNLNSVGQNLGRHRFLFSKQNLTFNRIICWFLWNVFFDVNVNYKHKYSRHGTIAIKRSVYLVRNLTLMIWYECHFTEFQMFLRKHRELLSLLWYFFFYRNLILTKTCLNVKFSQFRRWTDKPNSVVKTVFPVQPQTTLSQILINSQKRTEDFLPKTLGNI